MGLVSPFRLVTGFDRANLHWSVFTPVDKERFVLDYVTKAGDRSGIIYCNTRKTVEAVARLLQDNGFAALPYHAGMDDADRKRYQESFLYDRTRIMVATNSFGMGIDKPNVRYVLHFNMPPNLEDYYQQAGRAGRDGEPAECILLYSSSDVKVCQYFIAPDRTKDSTPTQETPDQKRHRYEQRQRLREMIAYARSTTCLRQRLLRYFGERFDPPCHSCSVCSHETVNQHLVNRERPCDEALWKLLQQRRDGLAWLAGVPAFAVVTDQTLREMASVKPQTMQQMAAINGMGEYKLDRYGKRFLKVIQTYLQSDKA